MVFLVLEIIIFLVLALLLGTLLGFLLSRSMVRDVRTAVEQLKLDVAANRKRLSGAETDLQLHKSSLNELRAAYDGLQERLSVHSDRQADLSGQMEGLVAARSALSERTATLASQLTEAQAGLGRQLEVAQQALAGRIDGLSLNRDEHAQRLLALETNAAHIVDQALARQADFGQEASNDDNGPALALATKLDERLTHVENQVVATEDFRAQHRSTQQQLEGLRSRVDVLAEADGVISKRLDEIIALPQRLTGLDENQQDIDARLSALEALPTQIENTRGQFERMQSTAAALTSRLEHQDRWGQETEERIGVLERQVGRGEAVAAAPSTRGADAPATARPSAPAPEAESSKDDLKRIKGVGVALERALNAAGVLRFEQIAAWGRQDIKRYANMLEKKFQNRITRDDWVSQARALLAKDGRSVPQLAEATASADWTS